MAKAAPTNTAARLLGGDTVHALYKLPFGSLLGRRAQLSSRVLKAFRKRWATVKAHAIDEISVLPPDKFYQIDVRTRVATGQEHDHGWTSNECERRLPATSSC